MLFRITKKHWIAVLLSFVIALLYSLPWLAFGQQPRGGVNESMTTLRVVYLSVVVFSTSLLFFYTNFILVKILGKQRALIRTALYILIQSIVVLACTVLLVFIADVALEVRAVKAYFVFYLLRNLILAAIVGLLTYVVELVDKLEKERMEVYFSRTKTRNLSSLHSAVRLTRTSSLTPSAHLED